MAAPFVISPPERRELMKVGNSRRARSEEGRRARIILDLGRGLSLRAISAGERCSVNTVGLWRDRFREDRLAGLYSRHRGRQPTPGREKLAARFPDRPIRESDAAAGRAGRRDECVFPNLETRLRSMGNELPTSALQTKHAGHAGQPSTTSSAPPTTVLAFPPERQVRLSNGTSL